MTAEGRQARRAEIYMDTEAARGGVDNGEQFKEGARDNFRFAAEFHGLPPESADELIQFRHHIRVPITRLSDGSWIRARLDRSLPVVPEETLKRYGLRVAYSGGGVGAVPDRTLGSTEGLATEMLEKNALWEVTQRAGFASKALGEGLYTRLRGAFSVLRGKGLPETDPGQSVLVLGAKGNLGSVTILRPGRKSQYAKGQEIPFSALSQQDQARVIKRLKFPGGLDRVAGDRYTNQANMDMFDGRTPVGGVGGTSVRYLDAKGRAVPKDHPSAVRQDPSGGIIGRGPATSNGAYRVMLAELERLGVPIERATIKSQAIGAATGPALLEAYQAGAKIRGVTDGEMKKVIGPDGVEKMQFVPVGLINENGLNIPALLEHYAAKKPLSDFNPGDGTIVRVGDEESKEVFDVPAHVVIPGAGEFLFTEDIAARTLAAGTPDGKPVIQLPIANKPETKEAAALWNKAIAEGRAVNPGDVVTNGGGSKASEAQRTQNFTGQVWTEQDLRTHVDDQADRTQAAISHVLELFPGMTQAEANHIVAYRRVNDFFGGPELPSLESLAAK
ncbi:MAG: hypothetical protein ACT4TC_14505 [Myxococcaceae bacterium]